ncbi:SDR family NAD(P)-dependent oxidoreductase [Flavisphingomonas formosensis]|uniref:SDR family NAD(P)-dependent oxidoreductase n=1 Tax=Flavisphingomonas formosensis TaxID=861534 RepID=UPI0012F96CD2|nr:SDR family NAD(P)-dependent oxidoreductase [Sphingomonas formosensis]
MASEFGNLEESPRTAIVTGGARRIGAALSRALAADGWHVLIHCRDSAEAAEALAAEIGHAHCVAADLADPAAAALILDAARDMPPPGLLVNNASGFVFDSFDDFTAADWDAHMDVNLRAPALLSQAFARAVPSGVPGLIVNILDAKLSAPNTDFFSYTISKFGLAGLTELSARVLASRGIRVAAIAPSVTLVSGEQSEANFAAVHAYNPLGHGVYPEQIVDALRFIVATPTYTGQTITLDGGLRFLGLQRDIQFIKDLESR